MTEELADAECSMVLDGPGAQEPVKSQEEIQLEGLYVMIRDLKSCRQ